MCNCTSCLHKRVCGQKEKYEQYIKEFNELNKKWDLFEKNPNCPEYTNQDVLITNQKENYDFSPNNKDVQVTYSDKTNIKPINLIDESKSNQADYTYRPVIISLKNSDDRFSIQDIIKELKKMQYNNLNKGSCY